MTTWIHLKVRISTVAAQVRIINSAGGTVYEAIPSVLGNISANGINVKKLSAGVYIVKVTNTNGLPNSITMIKY